MFNLLNLKKLALLSFLGGMMVTSQSFADNHEEASAEEAAAVCPEECACPCEEEAAPAEEAAPEEEKAVLEEEPAPEEEAARLVQTGKIGNTLDRTHR